MDRNIGSSNKYKYFGCVAYFFISGFLFCILLTGDHVFHNNIRKVFLLHYSPDLLEISRYLNLRFPEDAILVGSDKIPLPDNTMVARIRFPRSQMHDFLLSLPKSENISTDDKFVVSGKRPFHSNPDWWRPNSTPCIYALKIDLSRKRNSTIDILKMLFYINKKDYIDLYIYWEES